MHDPTKFLQVRVTTLSTRVVDRLETFRAEQRNNVSLLTRLTAHLGVIALVLIGLLLGGLQLQAAQQPRTYDQPAAQSAGIPDVNLDQSYNQSDITLSAVPFTSKPKKDRREVTTYIVQPGDNVSVIAARFGVTPDSVIWANAKLEENPDALTVGQTLYVPPVSGVLHKVAKGETLQTIAARFKAQVSDIFNDPFNQSIHDFKSSPPILAVDGWIMVPGGSKPIVQRVIQRGNIAAPGNALKGTANFQWPTSACISQYFWGRHPGLDLANSAGTAVNAADAGFVEFVGWDNTGYGNMILVNHGNGTLTRYAHLSAFAVQAGQSVQKGQLIGRIGSTGRSTGPHLHFEIIVNGVHRNPIGVVQGRTPGRCNR
ncbi:M23 family metallopeptidase [Anaerolineae bacterium CFX7]|nr:M23 family metallopeptidase [Anaerolineae bacterium CFX7]